MPERWQNELRKLREERMPDGIRERAEGGPQRQLPADGRQRLVTGLVAFAVFIAAGAFAWRAFDGGEVAAPGVDDPPRVIVTLAGNPGGPVARLSYRDRAQEGTKGWYRWCTTADATSSPSAADPDSVDATLGVCEEVQPFEHPRDLGFLGVPAGVSLDPAGDGTLTALETRPVMRDGTFGKPVSGTDASNPRMPDEPGRYAISVSASWGERGSAVFWFGVEVMPPVGEIPDVLHLTCTPENASLNTEVVRTQADGVHIAVQASDEVRGAVIVTGTTPETYVGIGLDERDDGTRGISIDPGTWSVGCSADVRDAIGPSDISPRTASFTVVDPADHYAEDYLACGEGTATSGPTSVSRGDGATPTVEAVAGTLSGMGPADVVREAGYGAERYKLGPLYVVQRGGETIAMIALHWGSNGPYWEATLTDCPGSGIVLVSSGGP